MSLIGAEAAAASAVAFLASAVVAAYVGDRIGFAIAPFTVLALAIAAAGAS